MIYTIESNNAIYVSGMANRTRTGVFCTPVWLVANKPAC